MDTWVWLVAYVAGFGLLQLLLYRHFSRRSSPAAPERRTDAGGLETVSDPADADVVVCRHCGTANEGHAMVRYCRDCAESLR